MSRGNFRKTAVDFTDVSWYNSGHGRKCRNNRVRGELRPERGGLPLLGNRGAVVYRGLESTLRSPFWDRWYGRYRLEEESFPSVEEAELHLLSQGVLPPEPRLTRPDLRLFGYTGKFEEKTEWRR